jgi:hypothetical protein
LRAFYGRLWLEVELMRRRLDRGTMFRRMEHAGATAGATEMAAMRVEAVRGAVHLDRRHRRPGAADSRLAAPAVVSTRPPLLQIADREHVFFEYASRETSAAVGEMFKDFSGLKAFFREASRLGFRLNRRSATDEGH